MTPEDFLAEVAQPNMEAALRKPADLRAIVNAILTLDALAGILHATGKATGRPEMVAHERDDDYREALARMSESFRALRDAAASLKHGELTDARKKRLARLVRRPSAMQAVPNGFGLFQCGDEIGGEVIVIEFDSGPGYVRASNIVANSYRMLARIVGGEPAQLDEQDRAFSADGPPDLRISIHADHFHAEARRHPDVRFWAGPIRSADLPAPLPPVGMTPKMWKDPAAGRRLVCAAEPQARHRLHRMPRHFFSFRNS